MQSVQTKILGVLRSRAFFIAVMILFVIESVWIAISAAYPMVFDENTHLGLIKLHAAQWWNPVFLEQPANSFFGGALTRDPSYFYHYLMSFPYLLISNITQSEMAQIIFLRFINIALFGAGLVLFRKLLLKTKVSPAIINVILLFFVLIPVVPLLAGQLNYDNMLMPLIAIALLMSVSVNKKIKTGKKIPIGEILLLMSLCMFSSLVKFEFLPIFAAIFLWISWNIFWGVRKGRFNLKKNILASWQKSSWKRKSIVAVPLVLATGFFFQMYGMSTIMYGTPLPHCDQILTEEQCRQYAPYNRDVIAIANKVEPNPNPILFSVTWVYRMFVAMFYTSSGGASEAAWYLSVNPLPIIFAAALLTFAVGFILLLRYHRTVFKGYENMGFLVFVIVVYCALLFARNYADYLVVGQKIAMNGRYLFPIALPVMLIFALAYRQLLGHRAHLKTALVGIVLLLFLQGGGAMSYLVASNPNWYWQNSFVVWINGKAKALTQPLVIIEKPLAPVTFTQKAK